MAFTLPVRLGAVQPGARVGRVNRRRRELVASGVPRPLHPLGLQTLAGPAAACSGAGPDRGTGPGQRGPPPSQRNPAQLLNPKGYVNNAWDGRTWSSTPDRPEDEICQSKRECRGYDRRVPDRLYFTDSDEANALIASEPMALLVGFVLDQQVSVQKAFAGPLALRERLGAIDAATLASADLESVFRVRPAIHRFPGSMAQRVHDMAVHVRDEYDGDAAQIWTGAADADALRANLKALPGFGEMKIKALGAVLAKRFGVAAAQELVPWHPTLGDVDSPQALADYQAAKRAHKAEWSKPRAPS